MMAAESGVTKITACEVRISTVLCYTIPGENPVKLAKSNVSQQFRKSSLTKYVS